MLENEKILKEILSIAQQILHHSENHYKTDSERLKREWIEGEDVEQIFRISTRTLQTWRENGRLPFSQIQRKIYYNASDVEKLLNDNYSEQ